VSREDRDLIEAKGLAVVDCSWHRLDDVPFSALSALLPCCSSRQHIEQAAQHPSSSSSLWSHVAVIKAGSWTSFGGWACQSRVWVRRRPDAGRGAAAAALAGCGKPRQLR